MIKCALPMLCTSTLIAAVMAPASAQIPSAPPAPPSPVERANAERSGIAGSVNGTPITFDQLIDRMQRDNPKALDQAVGQAVGPLIVKDALLGSTGKAAVTRAEIRHAVFAETPSPIYGELTTMMNEEALTQAAKKDGIIVTDQQVTARLNTLFDRLRKNNTMPPGTTPEQFLQQHNLTMPQVRSQVRLSLLVTALVERDTAGTFGHPVGPDDFLQARHILIQTKQAGPNEKPEDAKKDDDAALAKITAIRNDIVSGKKSFEDEARQNSEDPSNKESGGDLGVFMRGSMVKEFDTAAFTLKPHEISQPVKTSYGYHLIEVEKLGKDLTQAQRDDALERYDNQHQQMVANNVIKGAQTKNFLTPPVQPGFPGMQGRPGMVRPGMVRPGQPPAGGTAQPPR